MTLEGAIAHCLKVAEEEEYSAIMFKQQKEVSAFLEKAEAEKAENDCKQYAAEHRQFAEWLMELKDLREENKVLISECDRLIKEKGELLKMVNQPCTLCGNNCQVSPLEQFKVRNELCEARELMYRRVEK